eukprot:scaffold1850_cov194-Pinguiococcus_pyrenoidosus.AAC.59
MEGYTGTEPKKTPVFRPMRVYVKVLSLLSSHPPALLIQRDFIYPLRICSLATEVPEPYIAFVPMLKCISQHVRHPRHGEGEDGGWRLQLVAEDSCRQDPFR